jgi:UDP-N-acetylmuramoylalanine--D-glutamate ligase
MTFETLASQGNQTIYGSMAATIGPRINEIRNEFIKDCFSDFRKTKHRLEYVANVHGIEFINDSKATNINSTWFSLECMHKPIIWIVGGLDKGTDFKMLKSVASKKVKAIIWLGKDTLGFQSAFAELGLPITHTESLKKAVEIAYYAGRDGDVVLLSPACPSFDLFSDYEERGQEFRRFVNTL